MKSRYSWPKSAPARTAGCRLLRASEPDYIRSLVRRRILLPDILRIEHLHLPETEGEIYVTEILEITLHQSIKEPSPAYPRRMLDLTRIYAGFQASLGQCPQKIEDGDRSFYINYTTDFLQSLRPLDEEQVSEMGLTIPDLVSLYVPAIPSRVVLMVHGLPLFLRPDSTLYLPEQPEITEEAIVQRLAHDPKPLFVLRPWLPARLQRLFSEIALLIEISHPAEIQAWREWWPHYQASFSANAEILGIPDLWLEKFPDDYFLRLAAICKEMYDTLGEPLQDNPRLLQNFSQIYDEVRTVLRGHALPS